MPGPKVSKLELGRFGRILSLVFNRATMYQSDHPYVKQALDEFFPILDKLLKSISPLVFIMDREKFFIDEEPLDPRIVVSRLVNHFKKAGIQSVSFEDGLDKKELRAFLEIIVALHRYPNAEAMKKAVMEKGIRHLRINHVFFKKVTEDDEVVSREALEKVTPHMTEEAQLRSKKLFIDMVLESVLGEEFEKTLTMQNLVKNPTGLSRNMVEVDIKSFRESEAEDRRPGPILLHQLQMISEEVEKGLSGEGGANLSELAVAVFEMKKQLINGIEAKKSLDITYPDEEEILDKANEITDKVLIQLVKDEYRAGQISTGRLAQILRRLVPEADELKRLLPKIKAALLEDGMPLSTYMDLVEELSKELQSDELAKILKESSEEVGLDGKELIEEVKKNPAQAAELIFLAAEIQKGTGDEKVLTDLLVDYVEKLGSKLTLDIAKEDGTEGEQHLRQVITGLESNIVSRLRGMDIKDEVLERLEEKLNSRMDEILEKLRKEWIQSPWGAREEDETKGLSVLQILEQSVSENEELGQILKVIRSRTESEEVDENDFGQIYSEIVKEKQRRLEQEAKKKLPPGVLKSQQLIFFIKKEISRAKRYGMPFTVLSFSVVRAKPKKKVSSNAITQKALMDAILSRLANTLRESDVVGELGKNKLAALLPMTTQKEARTALRRSMKALHAEPIEVNGIPVALKMAGVATAFDTDRKPDEEAFIQTMSNELTDMIVRVKNIHELF
jgi:GGDEF domain-containing protein